MDNLSLKVENVVAKGEIARFEQFLLLSLCLKKLSAAKMSESVYMREMVNNRLNTQHKYYCRITNT